MAQASVQITDINYHGGVKRSQADEYVEIENSGNAVADLSGWRLTSQGKTRSGRPEQFVFPAGTKLQPGTRCRVYTNQTHVESGGYNFGSRTAIWRDRGDVGTLTDAAGQEISRFAYGDKADAAPAEVTIETIKADLGVPNLAVDVNPADITALSTPPPAGPVILQEAPAAVIADKSTVKRSLSTEAAGSVVSVELAVNISHTYSGDLRISLRAPDGTDVLLQSHKGGGDDNVVKTYTASNTPALASLTGKPIGGAWQLTVADETASDSGKLNSWKLTIKSDAPGATSIAVPFLDAFRAALNSFITDGSMSESPVWCMNENGLDFGLPAGADAAAKSAKVRELLNTSGCTMTLFTEAEDPSDEYVGAVMCDEDGKNYGTSSFWIFKLSDSPFTDSNTAVVDKMATKPTINWGYS